MRQINTENMDKVAYKGQEIAFGKCRKNEWGEYVVKVYVDGVYDEDKTIYADTREDAEATRDEAIKGYSRRAAEEHKEVKSSEKAKKAEIRAYINSLKKSKAEFYKRIERGEELDPFESTELDQLNGAIASAVYIFGLVYGIKEMQG